MKSTQFHLAENNTKLWIGQGAGHSNYLQTAPEEYKIRVINFCDQALLASS